MNKNDVLKVVIFDMGNDGEGIGKSDGFTVFVKDAVIGDTVEVKLMKVKKNYGYGKLIRMIESSPHRVEPMCPISRQCGGCQLQALNYNQQLVYKYNKVFNHLTRIGKFSEQHIESVLCHPIGMEQPHHYRNKAQFPVRQNKEGKVIVGFYAGRTHSIVDMEHCYIQAKGNDEIIGILKEFMEHYRIPAYDELTHTGLIRHILTRIGYHSGEVMVCLVINGKTLPHTNDFIQAMQSIPNICSISLNINTDKSNVIMGQEQICLWNRESSNQMASIVDSIGPIHYQISAQSFYQVNPVQTKILYDKVLEFADLKGTENVWDLYCGIGTIGLYAASYAKQIYGVEIVPQAVLDAKANAKRNHIVNADFFVGSAEEVMPQKLQQEQIRADVIVVDPPRKGCDERLLQTMASMKPEKIVYVSCDSATLARDLRFLCDRGYRLEKAQPVDCFPQTVHVETVIMLQKDA